MKRLILPDGELFYQDIGQGLPLLLLHAGVADSRMWESQFDAFGEQFYVVCCDLRGYGRSFLPNGLFAYYEDVRALVEALELRPTWIVGASFGAGVAVDFALTYPELVRGLILVSPVVGGFQPGAEVKQFGEQEDALLGDGNVEEATELNLRMWVDGPYRSPDSIDLALREQVGEMQRHAFLHPEPEHISLKRLAPPAIERVAEIRQPVLLVSGAADVSEFVQLAAHLAEEIPRAERVVIPDVAHMVTMEVPAQFTQLVLAFVATAGGSG